MLWLPSLLILPYLFLLLKIYRSLLRTETFRQSDDATLFVSVVIACRNEQRNLPAILKCLSAQTYPSLLFEVIIVNDWSDDNTAGIAAGFDGIRNMLILDSEGRGKKKALETGIKAAKGDLILTTDADCKMGTGWIGKIAAFYEKNCPDLIICPVQLDSMPGFFGRFQELEFLSLQGITAGCAVSGDATMCNGANLAFDRKAYLRHAGFLHNEINSGDDVFLLHRLKADDSKILWLESQEALVTAGPASTFTEFLKQRRRWFSKGRVYSDTTTIVLGLAVFITVALQILLLLAGLPCPVILPVFLLFTVLKSIPDLLILSNVCRRYDKKSLMRWFIPSQLIYPFYVSIVVLYSLVYPEKSVVSYPSPKGI